VGESELEGKEDCGGERRELDGALPPRDEGDEHGERDRDPPEHGLREPEVGNPLRVVLPPAPDREG
jgi:hypothetical protein